MNVFGWWRKGGMSCREFRRSMGEYRNHDPDFTPEARRAFEAHRASCPACAKEYKQDAALMGMVRKYWGVSEDTQKLLEDAGHTVAPELIEARRRRPMTLEEGWKDLQRRIPDLAGTPLPTRRPKPLTRSRIRPRRVGAVVAVAASIALVLLLGGRLFLSSQRTGKPASAPRVFAEWVTPDGNQPLALEETISTGAQKREFVLGGKHKVMANTRTRFSIQPLGRGGRQGYLLDLTFGELYVEVAHDGNPFEVHTPSANAVITGTRFDIQADADRTTLVVTEGSVRFESPFGSVDVTASHFSACLAASAPQSPAPADALASVGWARSSLRVDEISEDRVDLGLTVPKRAPIDLDAIDGDRFAEEHRAWFKSQFPWVFEWVDALATQGMDVDYPELLMVSGDVWQFHFPDAWDGPLTAFEPAAASRVAARYGVDVGKLLPGDDPDAAVLAGPDAPTEEALMATYQNAYERWKEAMASAAENTRDPFPSGLLFFSMRATDFLTNTRALAFAWLRAHPDEAEEYLQNNKLLVAGADWRDDWTPSANAYLKALCDAGDILQEMAVTCEPDGCEDASLKATLGSLTKELAITIPESGAQASEDDE